MLECDINIKCEPSNMNIWVTRYPAWVQLDSWIQAAPPADQREMRLTLQGWILPTVNFAL